MADDTAISYKAAVIGTPVLSSSGATIGTLEHVLEVPEVDVFDGIVIATHAGLRFIDADQVREITRSHIQKQPGCTARLYFGCRRPRARRCTGSMPWRTPGTASTTYWAACSAGRTGPASTTKATSISSLGSPS